MGSFVECIYCKKKIKKRPTSVQLCTGCQRHLRSIESQVTSDTSRFQKFGTYEHQGHTVKGKLNDKSCVYCKASFTPSGPAQKGCDKCRHHLTNITSQVVLDTARFKKFGTYKSIGKGYGQGRGKEHRNYKNGIGLFHSILSPAAKTRRYCEICGEDLSEAGRYHWCAHHKDMDRTNNTIDNIQLLCKRCHQMIHNCIGKLPNN